MQQTYGKKTAEYIAKKYISQWATFQEDGIFVSDECFENDPTGDVFQWTPACEMDGPAAPDPLTTPSLPFPFTANELAAFFVDGIGAYVASYYGAFEHGPDVGVLELMGLRAKKPREALLAAYAVFRDAEEIVGALDAKLQESAAALRHQCDKANIEANRREDVMNLDVPREEYLARRERARASFAALVVTADKVTQRASSELKAWRKAMVTHLLRPDQAAPNQVAAEAATAGEQEHAEFGKYRLLWRAVRLDERRVNESIEEFGRITPRTITEVATRDERLGKLHIELAQIHRRKDFLGAGADVDAVHSAENRYVIEEMAASRAGAPALDSDDVARHHAEIGEANEQIDALIANATRGPVDLVSASALVKRAGPLPLTTGDIAFCFVGLRCKTDAEWKTLLGKGRGWVENCLVQPGTRGRGGAPRLWNPVLLGAALVRRGHTKPRSVRAKFQTNHLLKPWLDEWKTYEADNFATE